MQTQQQPVEHFNFSPLQVTDTVLLMQSACHLQQKSKFKVDEVTKFWQKPVKYEFSLFCMPNSGVNFDDLSASSAH